MIGVGDKVMLVYVGCACNTKLIGTISEVHDIQAGRAQCVHCWAVSAFGAHAVIDLDGFWVPVPISWLRKLPPDAERISDDIAEPCTAV